MNQKANDIQLSIEVGILDKYIFKLNNMYYGKRKVCVSIIVFFLI